MSSYGHTEELPAESRSYEANSFIAGPFVSMKLKHERIEVNATSLGTPQVVQRGRIGYRVHSIDENWEYRGRWWLDAPSLAGTHREYYRVTCVTKSRHFVTMDIYQEGGEWFLARVID